MAFRYTLIGAAALAVTAVAGARAQSPFPPANQAQSPFPPANQQVLPPDQGNPQRQAAPPATQQKPPCFDQFLPLRQEVEKRFQAAKDALDKRATAPELCKLLTRFTQSEIAMIKYVEDNGAWCNFPPETVQSMKASHTKSLGYRKQACTAAEAPPRPQRQTEPSLSDALSPPVPNKDTTRTGRGTLDSLGGNPIGR